MEILNTIRTLKIIFEGEVELNDEDEFTLPYRIIQCRIKDMDLIEKIGTHRLTVKGYMHSIIYQRVGSERICMRLHAHVRRFQL